MSDRPASSGKAKMGVQAASVRRQNRAGSAFISTLTAWSRLAILLKREHFLISSDKYIAAETAST